jgi:hypothetical protein
MIVNRSRAAWRPGESPDAHVLAAEDERSGIALELPGEGKTIQQLGSRDAHEDPLRLRKICCAGIPTHFVQGLEVLLELGQAGRTRHHFIRLHDSFAVFAGNASKIYCAWSAILAHFPPAKVASAVKKCAVAPRSDEFLQLA